MKIILCFFLAVFLFNVFVYSQDAGLHAGQVPPDLVFHSFAKDEPVSYKVNDFNKTVFIIDFWATWCAPCIESIPHLNELVERYKNKNVKFISLTYEPEKLVSKFLKDHNMKSEVGLDDDFKMFRSYNAWAIPNIVMINSNGKIAGRIHPNKLNEEVIDILLNGGVPEVENTPEDLFDPIKAEEYFRTFLKKQE